MYCCVINTFLYVLWAFIIVDLCCIQVLQTITNHQNGHTGQLSTLSVFMTWTGSLGFIVVSLQVCNYSQTCIYDPWSLLVLFTYQDLPFAGVGRLFYQPVAHTVLMPELCPAAPGLLLQEKGEDRLAERRKNTYNLFLCDMGQFCFKVSCIYVKTLSKNVF